LMHPRSRACLYSLSAHWAKRVPIAERMFMASALWYMSPPALQSTLPANESVVGITVAIRRMVQDDFPGIEVASRGQAQHVNVAARLLVGRNNHL